jgi:hypothetical protein
MPRDDASGAPDTHLAELLGEWKRSLQDATPAELHEMMQQLMATSADAAMASLFAPPPSRRRPRRPDVATYQVRVDLTGTKPPLWRRLELASDLFLDDVHDAIQAAFGWTDTHLHRFSSGPPSAGRNAEQYLCTFDIDEGDAGVPEQDVRLDELLVEEGDRLYYTYDYGDDWQHTIRLEAIEPRDADAPRAVCTAGRRPDPPEDCGGVYGYELRVAAGDPDHVDHDTAMAELADLYGDDIATDLIGPTPFDLDETNAALATYGLHRSTAPTELPRPLVDLASTIRTAEGTRQLRQLIVDAQLDEPVEVDAAAAARMVHPFTWLLRRVGERGIKLTAAGYLPPAHVAAAFDQLGFDEEWIGKGNREDQTLPVLHLRETTQKAGLLRKHRGELKLTARGRAAVDDPLALWWQLAERMPARKSREDEFQAGVIQLLAVAAGIDDVDVVDATIATILDAAGWRHRNGAPLSAWDAAHTTWNTRTLLRRLGGLTEQSAVPSRAEPTADGVTFARAALRTWANTE